MSANTHLQIDPAICGEPVELEDGRSVVRLRLTENMAVDERGLTHGGFTFGLADYAVLQADRDGPAVGHGITGVDHEVHEDLLEAAGVALVGEVLEAHAQVTSSDAPRHVVEVEVRRAGGPAVFKGTFHCVVPDAYVLDTAS